MKLLPILALCGCIPTDRLDHYPGWDPDTCEISDPTFLKWADEIKEEDIDLGSIPHDPQEAFDYCWGKIAELGYAVRVKPKGVLGDFERFTTTLPLPRFPRLTSNRGVVWVAPDWESRDILHKMFTACHEYVHAATEVRLGFDGSSAHYSTDEGRLAFELGPYWLDFALRKRHGYTVEQLRSSAGKAVISLHQGYQLTSIPETCLRKTAFSYWEIP
jgi:hypothetical protein